MNKAKLKRYLNRLHQNLNILREREAKTGGNTPLDLLNEIEDYQSAIALVESRLAGDISEEQIKEELARLNVIPYGSLPPLIPVPTIPLVAIAVSILGLLSFVSYRLVAPTPGPTQMSGLFNVAVAEFGEVDAAGQIRPSTDGQQLSQWIYDGLQLELENLPLNLRQELQPQVWHDSLPLSEKGVKIGIIPDEAAAARLAQALKANVIIYGNLQLNDDTASFVPEFYVASLRGEADEIVGRHQLRAPIPVQAPIDLSGQAGLAVNKQLIARTKALSRFTLGLIYDLSGFSEDALRVFQQAIEELDLGHSSGEAVFYYFMGRSALFLNQDDAAQTAFEQARTSDARYARPYIGLGSVYSRRAQCRLFDAADQETNPGYQEICRRQDGQRIAPCQSSREACLEVVQQDARQAIENYQKAIAFADESLEPQTKVIGHLALGTSYRLLGDLYVYQGDGDTADSFFDQAIKEIQSVLEPMAAAGQHRYLGQAYLALGAAYAQQAWIRQNRGAAAESIALFKKAREAYGYCLAQKKQSPTDLTLAQKIIAAGCEPYDKRAAEALAKLEGGP